MQVKTFSSETNTNYEVRDAVRGVTGECDKEGVEKNVDFRGIGTQGMLCKRRGQQWNECKL